jgi:hypothetical protein
MIISITGGSAKLKDLAESITRYSAELLLDKKLIEKLTVDIEFSRTLLKEDGMLAEIDFDDRANKPREFTITVDSTVPQRRIMESIAHEMVHLKQYAVGEMRDTDHHNIVQWKKKPIDLNKWQYWDRPWEIEAHGKELGLFIRWAEHCDLSKESWTQEQYDQ